MEMKPPFFLIVILQVLSFIILFVLEVGRLEQLYLQAFFIVLQLAAMALVLFRANRRFFYLIWQFQFYIAITFKILFRYEESFGSSFNITAAATLLVLVTFLELIVVAGFIFMERSVKPILATLSTTTSFAVILIIVFIFREGYPAFIENDPIEYITGSDWSPDYWPGDEDTITISLKIVDHDHEMTGLNDRTYMRMGMADSVRMTLKNTGFYQDTYNVKYQSSEQLTVELKQTVYHLDVGEETIIDMNVTVAEHGEFELSIISISTNGSKQVQISTIIVGGNLGVDVWANETLLIVGELDVARAPLHFKNTGIENDSYLITVEYEGEDMMPSVERTGRDWDWDNRSMILDIAPGETVDGMLLPRNFVISYDPIVLNVTARSISDQDIYDTVKILFQYKDIIFFEKEPIDLTVGSGGSLEIPLTVNVSVYKDIHFNIGVKSIKGPVSSFVLSDNDFAIVSEGEFREIDIREGGRKNLTLTITSESLSKTQDRISIVIVLERAGSEPSFGIGPMIVGTIILVITALAIAIPLGLGTAIFLAEYCPKRLHNILRPMFELLSGIPSIIYGLWGYFTLAPFFRDHVNQPVSDSIGRLIPFLRVTRFTPASEGTLAVAGFVLAIMILPIIITLSEDSIRSVSVNLKEGSLALGTTKWQTIRGTIMRKARSGIVSSVILAMGRAIGETMAVLMILRLAVRYPASIFERGASMTGAIASTFGWSFDLDRTRHAVFGIAIILFLMVFALNMIVYFIQYGKGKKRMKPHIILSRLIDRLLKRMEKVSIPVMHRPKSSVFTKQSYKMTSPRWIYLREYIAISFFIFCAVLIVSSLFFVLSDVFFKGITSMEISYLFEREISGGLGGGGFANAIVGSIQLTGLTLLISIPFSVGAAIYVQQYTGERNIFTRIILFASDTLASTPSIVFGAFGFIFFSIQLEMGLSMLSAGLTLAIMVIPLLLRSSIEALKSIPKEIAEGSLSLGASKWQTIWHVILPPAMGGITSGIILSIGRAIGETAAVLFTAGYALGFNNSIMSPVSTMTNMIYNYYGFTATEPELADKVFSCALVLIMIVLIMNSIARIFQWRSNKTIRGKY